ncbi:MAG: hypothetical protein U0528_12535 [Anaerolineae bacterium]
MVKTVARHTKRSAPEAGSTLTRIAILTPFGEEKSRLKEGMKLGTFALTRRLNPSAKSNEVTIATVQSFKGMERPAIILTEFARFDHGKDGLDSGFWMSMHYSMSQRRGQRII